MNKIDIKKAADFDSANAAALKAEAELVKALEACQEAVKRRAYALVACYEADGKDPAAAIAREAHQNRSRWSNGPQYVTNVLEAIRRDAALDILNLYR